MDRSTLGGRRRLLALFAILAVSLQAGCTALATALYVIDGNNVNAEYAGLKGKRVVVVCRPTATIQYSSASVAKELAAQIGSRLANSIRKIDVVSAREVAEWTDENEWDEPTEVGTALGAQMVVAVDIDRFSLYQGQTLFQGKAIYTIRVYDLENGEQVVYEKSPPESTYPPNIAIPTSEQREQEFRREFVGELAEEIGRHFYDHDTRVDFAKDSRAVLH